MKTTPDGVVKVLDFGLAKAVAGDGSAPDPTESPTVHRGTGEGVILGTAGYMSPEQARGKAVDRRADLWAFGAVLYEMVTGRRAFTGDNVSDTIAQVLTKEPDWTALPAKTPAPLRTLLRRCLEKDQKRRLDSATAARLDIDDALATPMAETTAPDRVVMARPGRVALVLAALAAAGLVTSLVTRALMRPADPAPAAPSQFLILPPSEEPLGITYAFRDVALSPDGRRLAYHSGPPLGGGRLILRALDQLDAKPLPGIVSAISPFFSPDSQWVGFFEAGAMKKVAVTGGPVITLAKNLGSPESGSWGDGGAIVFSAESPNQGLLTLSANGGETRALTTTDATQNEIAHDFPSVLPGERGVLFTIRSVPDDRQLAVLDLRTGQRKTLLRGGLGAEYVDTGHLVYEASGTLFAIGFDLDRLELQGEPAPLRETLQVGPNWAPKHTVSRAGTLAFVPASGNVSSLVWVDRTGRETPIHAPPRAYDSLHLSPDGARVALEILDEERDVWIWDFARETLTRLTFGPSSENTPIWTPDGRWIVFRSDRAGPANLYRQASDGSGAVERLTASDNDQHANSVTPDGKAVLGAELLANSGYDILRFPASPPARSGADNVGASASNIASGETLIATPSAEYAANISPDGRYVAYQSMESGRFEIYVQPYPNLSQGRWQISTGGGVASVWARNGRELFYLDGSNTLMAVPIEMSRTGLSPGRPFKVFDKRYAGDFYSYDVSPDAQRFLMLKQQNAGDQGSAPAGVVVALNWFEQLKARAK